MPEEAFAQKLDKSISIQKSDTLKALARLDNQQLSIMTHQSDQDSLDMMDSVMTREMRLLNRKAMAAVVDTMGGGYIRPLSSHDVSSAYRGAISRKPLASSDNIPEQLKAQVAAGLHAQAPGKMGALSSKYESGKEGISAVGYDARGGTSYGKYQFSSKAGIVDAFIKHLDKEVPQLAQMLRNAGPANTGGRQGNMPKVWRQIASEHKELFERLQDDFTRRVHLEPAMNKVKNLSGVDVAGRSEVFKEVLLSTAVQHGPSRAGDIFVNAINKTGPEGSDAEIIENVYADRKRRFGSSSPSVRRAVVNRLEQEKKEALAMLKTILA